MVYCMFLWETFIGVFVVDQDLARTLPAYGIVNINLVYYMVKTQ